MPEILESIQVWVVPVIAQNTERWKPVLTAAEWEKAMRFRMAGDQRRSAVARGVLRTLLGRYLNRSTNNIEFRENANGKYALPDGAIEFNVSHSGDYVLLAFAKNAPVGIDVEQMKDERVVNELARRVLTAGEYRRFIAIEEDKRRRAFFEIWALKEAVLKGIGSGLSVAPECIEIAFYPDEPRLLTAETEEIRDVTEWTLRSLDIGDSHYAAAIAVKDKAPVIAMNEWVG